MQRHYIHMHAFIPISPPPGGLWSLCAPLDSAISRSTMIELEGFGGSHACMHLARPPYLCARHGGRAKKIRRRHGGVIHRIQCEVLCVCASLTTVMGDRRPKWKLGGYHSVAQVRPSQVATLLFMVAGNLLLSVLTPSFCYPCQLHLVSLPYHSFLSLPLIYDNFHGFRPQGDASPLMGSEGEEMGQKEKEEGIWKRPFSPSSAPCRFFTRLLPPLLLCAILPPRFP
ncbi:hypothetical protein GW17_00008994 [Ensete ventricosum]|nr:hypothetical protein GW17_00008994 [Ensete ventricosum]